MNIAMAPRRRAALSESWILLMHQIPPRPLYLRAKTRQQLARIGAIPVKKSVYALPDRPECLEDFQWIAQEVRAGGGEAFVCRAEFVEPAASDLLRSRSRAHVDAQYGELLETLSATGPSRGDPGDSVRAAISRIRSRHEEIRRVDFFDSARGKSAARRIAEVEMRLSRSGSPSVPASKSRLSGKTWVTRPGVKVDRIASAWFVRRFVDAKARFRFDAPSRKRRAGDVFFDVVNGDFTHEGDRCTLETLLVRTANRDPAAAEIAEIVHDIDLKDAKFRRPEAPGVARIVAGLLETTSDDARRLRDGFPIFDQLYRSFAVAPKTRKGAHR